MNNDAPRFAESPNIPESYWIGQELNWEASPADVVLFCELPFWVMVPNCSIEVEVNNYKFKVEIRDDLIEKYAGLVGSSKSGWIYVGPPYPDPNQLDTETKKNIEEHNVSVVDRKCKSVFLYIRVATKMYFVQSTNRPHLVPALPNIISSHSVKLT